MADLLADRVQALFQAVIDRARGHAGLEPLAHAVVEATARVAGPMRVAVVGKIKAGKSTLMNALIGESILATGGVETTYNVSWMVHAAVPGLVLHYKDGRPPEPRPFADLHATTKWERQQRDSLLALRHVEVRYPAAVLRRIELIDTPGLESVYEDDSANTGQFLNLYAREMTDRTVREAAVADATLYLFSQALSARDEEVLQDLQGAALGRATPLNSIAVLTKVDAYWPDADDPRTTGRQIADRLCSRFPKLRQLFYTLRPVSGALGLGAQTLPEDEFAILARLASLPGTTTDRLLGDVRRLCEREYDDVPVPCAERKRVWSRLGRYGIWEGCRILRAGTVANRSALQAHLFAVSGVTDLVALLLTHFGNRAYLIKLVRAFDRLREVCFHVRYPAGASGTTEVASWLMSRLEEIELTDPAFAELRALHAYYSGEVELEGRLGQELLEVTGEFGLDRAARLGLLPSTPESELFAAAENRARRWRQYMNASAEFSPALSTVCRIVAASCTRLMQKR